MNIKGTCETVPTVYSPYPKRLESLTIHTQTLFFLEFKSSYYKS